MQSFKEFYRDKKHRETIDTAKKPVQSPNNTTQIQKGKSK